MRNIDTSVTPVVTAVENDQRCGDHDRGSDIRARRTERSHDAARQRGGETQRYQQFDDARHVPLPVRFTNPMLTEDASLPSNV